MPRWRQRRGRIENQHSTRLSQNTPAGVKCGCQRGRLNVSCRWGASPKARQTRDAIRQRAPPGRDGWGPTRQGRVYALAGHPHRAPERLGDAAHARGDAKDYECEQPLRAPSVRATRRVMTGEVRVCLSSSAVGVAATVWIGLRSGMILNGDWSPISAAPRDGTPVILWMVEDGMSPRVPQPVGLWVFGPTAGIGYWRLFGDPPRVCSDGRIRG
jgi:hypothetical protein